MATKDWLLTTNTPKMKRYVSPKETIEIFPVVLPRKRRAWFVSVITKTAIKDAEFPTKIKAMARAKAYMRSH